MPIQAKVRELFQAKIAKLTAITPRRHGDDVSDDMKNLRYLFKVPATLSSVKQIDEAGSADDDELPASGARLLAKLRDKLKIFAQQRKDGNDFLGSLQEEIRALITQCQRVGQFDLSDGDFTGLDLSKLNLTHIRRSTFNEHTLVEDMTLTSSWLSRQNLQIFLPHGQAWKRNPNGRPLLSLNTVSFEGEDLSRLNLSGLYLQKVYFRNCNLRDTRFGDADVKGADFKYAKNFNTAPLRECINRKSIKTKVSPAQQKRDHDTETSHCMTNFFKKKALSTTSPDCSASFQEGAAP